MSWLEFLTTMENSLNSIEVKGEDNLRLLLGCLDAVSRAKKSLMSINPMNIEQKPTEAGGEEDGRQSDKHTDPC